MLQRQHIMLKRWMTTVAQNAFEKYVTINDFLQNSKAYREFIQISKMVLFAKKVNNFQPLTIFGKSSIWNVRASYQCASGYTRFFYISNTFTGNPRLKLAKNWAKANTLFVNFRYLETICFLHPHYYPNIVEDILKNVLETSASIKVI